MQVILKERLEHLGNAGDVVTVKPGYARNYLVPKGLAYEANDANLKRIGREREQAARHEAEAVGAARESAKAIEGLSVTFTARAGEEGKLFGSITSSDIAEKLAEQGVEIDRRQIQLDEPIKALGVFTVAIRLHAEVRPELKVWVVKED
jgi:large subunit ribosomal protein L9